MKHTHAHHLAATCAIACSLTCACALACSLTAACAPPALRPFPDRPILILDDDRRPLGQPPRPWRRGSAAAALAHQVSEPVDRWLRGGDGIPARNVNALGEVPASTWFQPRRRPLSGDALRRGAASTPGPSYLGPWTITAAGTDLEGPYLKITDEDQQRFLLRFDAPGYPRLATSACMVSTLILHALGYHVPERHLLIFEPQQLSTHPGRGRRSIRGTRGRRTRPPTDAELKGLLSPLPRLRDGSLRAVATRLDGSTDLGPFRWSGTRPDDPNDFVPHELRRELRGLGPVAAWLNLTGITEEVPRDLYYPDAKRRHVVHSLTSLRGSLGSTRAGRPKPLWEGFANLLSLPRMMGKLATLGGLPDPWRRLAPARRRALVAQPGLGWLPRGAFRPRRWSPRLGNEAFARADHSDLHWGARLLATLTREQLQTIVEEAYLPTEERDALVATLWQRRQAVLKTWLGARAPLDEVRLETQRGQERLCVTDLWHREGLSGTPSANAIKTSPAPREAAPANRPHTPLYQVRHRLAPAFRPGPASSASASMGRLCVPLPRPPITDDYLVMELRRPDLSSHWLRVHLRRHPQVHAGDRPQRHVEAHSIHSIHPSPQGSSWRLAGLER